MTSRGATRAPLLYRFCRGLITDDRGQSESIGVVLLIGITVMGTVGLVAFGSTAISDTERFMNAESASHTMGQMNSQASEVALGESESQRVELPRGDGAGQSRVTDEGWMKMEVINDTENEVEAEVFNESLGAVVYEDGDERVAYQGGGVWKQSGNETEMVSAPEFHYRGNTLTVPVIQVSGDELLTRDATVRKNGSPEQLYPTEEFPNPFADANHTIRVTVHSEYYQGWGEFFDTRTDGLPSVDHDDQTASLTMVAEVEEHTVEGAVGSTAAGGDFELAGNGAYTDSYDSEEGPYEESRSWNGTVVSGGNVEISGGAELRGNVETGGYFDITGSSAVHGDVNWTTRYDVSGSATHNGTDQSIEGLNSPGAIDDHVESTVNDTRNDPDPTANITDNELNFEAEGQSGEITLEPGSYYLDELHVSRDDTLYLDAPDDGDEIVIAVDGDALIEGHVHLKEGDGNVSVYVLGSGSTNFAVEGQGNDFAEVTVPDDRATRMWVYGTQDFTAVVDRGTFQGVLYAPTPHDMSNPGEVTVEHGSVYGGIVSGATSVEQNGEIHFDESLQGQRAVPEDTTVVIINYVHATLNEIEFED